MSGLNPNFKKRDYLLPSGCKDLIDVLNLEKSEALHKEHWPSFGTQPSPSIKSPIEGQVVELSEPIGVKVLAELLAIKPHFVIADLMHLGIFATLQNIIPFETAEKVLARYGVTAKRLL